MGSNKMLKEVIIYGGCGQLGRCVLSLFKENGYKAISIDRVPNDQADQNVIVTQTTLKEQAAYVNKALEVCSGVPAVINVAGGWCGGNASSDDFIDNVHLALQQSVWTSAVAAGVAAKKLNEGGLFILPGAAPVCSADGTPGMIAYGASKAAVHHMAASCAAEKGGLASGTTTLCLAPVILDTPMNRKFMPKANFSTWTPLPWVAERLLEWTEDPSSRPKSGSICKIVTKDNQTDITLM